MWCYFGERDLRSPDSGARAPLTIFKALPSSYLVRTSDRTIYHLVDHFQALIIYVTLHDIYKPGLQFQKLFYLTVSALPLCKHRSLDILFLLNQNFLFSYFEPRSSLTYSTTPTMFFEPIEDTSNMSIINKFINKSSWVSWYINYIFNVQFKRLEDWVIPDKPHKGYPSSREPKAPKGLYDTVSDQYNEWNTALARAQVDWDIFPENAPDAGTRPTLYNFSNIYGVKWTITEYKDIWSSQNHNYMIK